MKYRPGKNHGIADAMPRKSSTNEVVAAIQELTMDALKAKQLSDMQLVPVVKPLRREGLHLKNQVQNYDGFPPRWTFVPKILRIASSATNTQLVMPINTKEEILHQLHDDAGHLWICTTTGHVKEQFYWPGYESDIENWVYECQHVRSAILLNLTHKRIKANCHFEKISWDIMDPLPISSKGRKHILVVTDIFS